MKKYEKLYLEVVELKEMDIVCTSGEKEGWEFDDNDIWGNG